MVKGSVHSVDDYIASRPKPVQTTLKRLRSILRRALPGAEEVISYQIPAYRLQGKIVIYFAGWREHYSLYPSGSRLPDALKEDLESYEQSRGTIRFELSEPIPEKLIARIARFRAKEAAEKAKASAPKKKSPKRTRKKRKRV